MLEKIKVSELFYSLQGEGKYIGVPSIFLRTFGCNFRCAGFGMPRGEKSVEADNIAINALQYKQYKDLPLVSTGCDSYASWHPKFKHLSPVLDVDEVSKKIVGLLPHNCWKDVHLVITGGEPLLGWQRAYPSLLQCDNMLDLKFITFETNGTQVLTPQLKSFLKEWKTNRNHDAITFSVSAKLSCSGETETIKPDVVHEYEDVGEVYLKFVVADEQDVIEAIEAISLYRSTGFSGVVYLMPAGGVESVYSLNNRNVANLALKYGFRYSDRLQVPLFKNEWGT